VASGAIKRELALLLAIYDQAYEGRSWHGTNLRGSTRGLSATAACWRPREGRHSIDEVVLHAAYWKYAVCRRLTGDKRGSFPLEGSNWFARSGPASNAQWRADLALLERFHRQLRGVIESLADAELHEAPDSGRYTRATLIYGVASHDLYHAGQIQLLKRLLPL
jgi:hypothetical protein